jgi:hypothetical protein
MRCAASISDGLLASRTVIFSARSVVITFVVISLARQVFGYSARVLKEGIVPFSMLDFYAFRLPRILSIPVQWSRKS